MLVYAPRYFRTDLRAVLQVIRTHIALQFAARQHYRGYHCILLTKPIAFAICFKEVSNVNIMFDSYEVMLVSCGLIANGSYK